MTPLRNLNSILFFLVLIYHSLHSFTIVKRRPEMDTNGFYGDTFSSGFGDFYTAKRSNPGVESISSSVMDQSPFSKANKFYNTLPYGAAYQQHLVKRRPEMDTNGFYGDTFSSGFGDFYTAKRSSNHIGRTEK